MFGVGLKGSQKEFGGTLQTGTKNNVWFGFAGRPKGKPPTMFEGWPRKQHTQVGGCPKLLFGVLFFFWVAGSPDLFIVIV